MTERLSWAIVCGDERARVLRAEAVERAADRALNGDRVTQDRGPSLPAIFRRLVETPVVHRQMHWRR